MRWLDSITDSIMSLSKLWDLVIPGRPGVLQSMGSQWDCKESHMTFTFSCVEFITFLLSSTVAGLHLESIFDLDM